MTAASAYSSQDAAAFANLAALANTDFSGGPLILPPGWAILATAQPPQFPGLQAYLAQGAQPSAPQNTIAVLAVGMQWLPLLNWYNSTVHQLNPLSPYLVTGAGSSSAETATARGAATVSSSSQFDFGYQTLYGYLRGAVWNQLSFVAGLNLFVAGHGPAAPLAQLAALDLSPAKASTTSPVQSVTAYTFSTPALGDQNFQAFFQQQVPACYAGVAQGTSLIDFFPTPPAGGPWVQPSQVQPVAASLPQWDDPWYERSSEFYEAALGSPANAATTSLRGRELFARRSRLVAASTYDADLAYTLAQLSAIAYQQYQHPNLSFTSGNWTLVGNVQTSANGTVASIFTSPTQGVIAFRGTVPAEELLSIQSNYFLSTLSYLPQTAGSFSTGISQLYTSLRGSLLAALGAIPNLASLSLYVTGHSLGGALATLCAVDLSTPQGSIPVPTALYTYGAPPFGDYVFQSYFGSSSLAGVTFRIARTFDIMPLASHSLLAQAPSAATLLSGTTPYDGVTFHPISGYIELLSP